MADKFRNTFVIPISFADGEQPTGTKLNAVSSQARNGLAVLERAIGDLWNQSGDATASAFPNRIVNLARTLGDQAKLSSEIPLPDFTGTTSVRIRQPIANFLGKSEILLDFKPTVDATLRASVDALRYTASLTYASTETATPLTDDQWAVDTSTAKIKLGAALYSTQPVAYIEYNVAAADFALSTDAVNSSSFSMIPAQTQGDWRGLKICQIAANQYHIVLPFRRPDTSPTGLSKLPLSANNSVETGSPTTVRYWGPVASGYSFNSTISSNRFYRHSLPQLAQSLFVTPVAGTAIPTGVLYLWDTTTNTIIEGVTFRVPSVAPTLGGVTGQQPFILQAEGVTLDQVFNGSNGNFTSSMTTDVPADYMSRFALICVGQSIADTVDKLKQELTEGNRAVGPGRRLSHGDLSNTQPAYNATNWTRNVPASFVSGDDHPHLLSRLGSSPSGTTSAHRDRYNNGILGDLLILSSDSADNYQNINDVTRYIYFGGHGTQYPRINGSIGFTTINGVTNTINLGQAHLQIPDSDVMLFRIASMRATNYGLALSNSQFGNVDGTVWGARALFNGTTQNLGVFTGSVNSTRYIDIDARTSNDVNFLGGNLTIGSTNGNVVVDGSSYLRIANNRLLFSTADDSSDSLIFNETWNTFTFRADNSGSTGITNAIAVAGRFRAVDNAVEFGGNDAVSVGAAVTHNTGLSTYYFTSLGSVPAAINVGSVAVQDNAGIDDSVTNTLFANNIPKAWGCIRISSSGGAPLIITQNGFNIMPVVISPVHSTTRFRVTFASPMANANYCVTMTTMPSGTDDFLYEMIPTFGTGYKDSTFFEFGRFSTGGLAGALNVQGNYLVEVSFSVFASQA